MVTIDRYRGNPSAGPRTPVFGPVPGRKVVFARAIIMSDREQIKKMNLGYSDEVTVYLNGKKLFTGRSNFLLRLRSARSLEAGATFAGWWTWRAST